MDAKAGKRLLDCLIQRSDGAAEFVRLGLVPDMFLGTEEELYGLCAAHVEKYGKLPGVETVDSELGLHVTEPPESIEYYHDQVKKRYVYRQMKVVLEQTRDRLVNDADDPEQALNFLCEQAMSMTTQTRTRQIVDFARDALPMLQSEYRMRRQLGDAYGVNTGWPTLDRLMLGMRPGDLISMVGRPAKGKTWNLLYAAHHAWHEQQHPCMFVSMEMKPLEITQRFASMHSHVPITPLRAAALETSLKDKLWADLSETKDAPPFWVIDGSMSATVPEIVVLARRFQPSVVYIDGGYLIRSRNWRQARHERIAETAEGLKGDLAQNVDVPVFCTWQFNREAAKKKSVESGGLENIAGSDAIGQASSVVLGLMEDDSPETLLTRRIDIMKGRSGEIGSFRVNWIFDGPYGPLSGYEDRVRDARFMDFSEYWETDETLDELEYE